MSIKKYVIICFAILSATLNFYAQNTKYGLVRYGHKQSLGMGGPIGVDYNATLLFNNKESIYTFRKDSLEGGHIRENLTINKDDDNMFLITKVSNELGFLYHYKLENKQFRNRDLGFRYVKEKNISIPWKIKKEKKVIGKFECTKAEALFRGRNYTAWFTEKIPLPYGPWKLHGLPGLILEAYDDNKEVYFYFKSVNYPYTSKKKIKIKTPNPDDENKKWISLKEYREQMKASFKRSIENARMLMEQQGFNGEENEMLMKNVYIEVFE